MKHTLHNIRYLALLPAFLTSTAVLAERTFKWVDDEGKVQYGDRIPPQYSDREREEINYQGRTIRVYEAPKTPKQKAEDKRLAVIATAKKKLAEKQLRQDRTLLATYSSEEDMVLARDGKIDSVESLIQLTHRRISSLQKSLLDLTEEAAGYERSGQQLPKVLQHQIINVRDQLTQNKEFVKDKQLEIEDIRQQFDADIKRFQELTSDDPTTGKPAAHLTPGKQAEKEQPATPVAAKKKPKKKIPDKDLTRYDRTLLASYSSEEDIRAARNEKVAPVDSFIQETSSEIDSMHLHLAELLDNADEYERNGEELPDILLLEMNDVLEDITKNEEILETRKMEKENIEQMFGADLKRFSELQGND